MLGRGFLNEDACSSKSFCGSDCKALHWRMQSFAWRVAKLCVGSCKALRWQLQSFASEMGKTGTVIFSHILDKRKGRTDSSYGSL